MILVLWMACGPEAPCARWDGVWTQEYMELDGQRMEAAGDQREISGGAWLEGKDAYRLAAADAECSSAAVEVGDARYRLDAAEGRMMVQTGPRRTYVFRRSD
ncbi:MAG: hypothetical protein GY871_02025 [Actinomycetales bacterium]|nr:hypothetical protein [Actinomycetales bacterium]